MNKRKRVKMRVNKRKGVKKESEKKKESYKKKLIENLREKERDG